MGCTMKKWNWYLGETIVENENWMDYSIETLEQIRKDTLEYYENKYDIKGMCEDLIKYCGEPSLYDNNDLTFYDVHTKLFLTNPTKIIVLSCPLIEYASGSYITPGDWTDWLLKVYEKNLPEINEKKNKEKENFVKNYFTKGIL